MIHPPLPNDTVRATSRAWASGSGRASELAAAVRSITADNWQDFAGDIAGAVSGGQEHIGRGDLLWLCRPLHRGAGAEMSDLVGCPVGGVERRPDRAGCDCVHPYSTPDQIAAQCPGEGVDAALGHRVVEQLA